MMFIETVNKCHPGLQEKALELNQQCNRSQAEELEELIAFPTLFARQLIKTPDNTALVFEDKNYTYQQLDHLSDEFSQAVLSQLEETQTKQACIGICIDKSPEAIAAMLGILKAGAAFVPLDPEYPADRIAYMIDDAEIMTIIAQPKHQQRLQQQFNKPALSWIDCYKPLANKTDSSKKQLDVDIQPHDLAYIMYTSGSTGKPKGVQIEHAALATYCYADIEVYKVVESDRTLQFSTINFDIAIEEIFPPLLTGSTIVIRPSKRSSSLNELSTIINDYNISAVHIATAYWHEWVDLMLASNDTIPASLRLMVVTGEKVSTHHYQHWKKLCEKTAIDVLWCNAYGPTEATVSASVFIPDENFSEDNMPIGKPLKRYTAVIVDENNNSLGVGETGQLLIGGPALARGYLNRPELNADVFVTLNTTNGGSERMYKTGDLARWRENGDIEFAGRIDHQIKLGSYRIEPGEIEVAINEYPEVLESLVSYDEVESKKALIAYIAQGENNISLERLSDNLKQNLPAYMVPARFVLLKSFPKTTNGKIDRKALPDPSTGEIACSSGFVAPRNELEKNLANMWQEVLRLPQVGIHDDFFALGGSSLLAVGIVSRLISEMDLELPVRDFFANPTIASQAAHIQRLLNNNCSDTLTSVETAKSDSQALRDRLPKITPSFFKSTNNKNLYGILYQPPVISHASPQSHAVLMCHPLGHEYPRSYRNLQQLAIQLAQAGFDVFRFDYYATGNSEGSSEEITAEQCALDIEVAADYLRQKSNCEKLSVLAVRFGAPFAIQANLQNIENMIVWDPVISGEDHLAMLEKFHDKELKAYNFFRQIRHRSEVDQLFGHAYSDAKRRSLAAVTMKTNLTAAKKHYFISSASFLDSEKKVSLLTKSQWQQLPNNDEIYWHDQDYAFSAFSSPQTFKMVFQILDEHEESNNDKKEKAS